MSVSFLTHPFPSCAVDLPRNSILFNVAKGCYPVDAVFEPLVTLDCKLCLPSQAGRIVGIRRRRQPNDHQGYYQPFEACRPLWGPWWVLAGVDPAEVEVVGTPPDGRGHFISP